MDTRVHSFIRVTALLALGASVAACAETTPRWDSSFGVSVRSTFAAQVANPAAARNANPVSGLDGHSARAAYEQYERANTRPQAAPDSLMNGGLVK